MNAPLPTAALLGEIEVAVGAGLLIVNVVVAEVPPPGVGVNTVTDAVEFQRFFAGNAKREETFRKKGSCEMTQEAFTFG